MMLSDIWAITSPVMAAFFAVCSVMLLSTGDPSIYCTVWMGHLSQNSYGYRSAFLEFATGAAGATGAGEVVAGSAARTPHPTRAGGQDDGSYTNSLK